MLDGIQFEEFVSYWTNENEIVATCVLQPIQIFKL